MDEKSRRGPSLSQRFFATEPRRNPFLAYGMAVLAVLAVGSLVRLSGALLRPTPFFPFYGAVMIAAWYGGFGPGLTATLLSGIIAQYLSAPFGDGLSAFPTQVRLAGYILIGSLISALSQSLYVARGREAARAAQERSARQDAEAERRRTTESLETITDGFLMADRDLRYTFVNAAACALLRATPDQLIGRPVLDLFPEAGVLPAMRELRLAMERQIPVRIETFYAAHQTWFESYIYPSAEGFTALIHDITERKRAVDALRESEERLRLALETGGMGTWDWDAVSNKLEWSEGLERIFGVAPGTFGGTFDDWVKLLHPEDREQVLQVVHESMRDRDQHRVEHRVLWPDGQVRWVQGMGRVIRDPEGHVVRMVGVSMDVTERKLAEERIRRSVAELERSNSELEQFAATISHDLRGPLQTVTIYGQLVERKHGDKLPAEAREFLGFIVSGLSRMGALVDDLLTYSGVGKERYEAEPIELTAALDRVVMALGSQIQAREAEVTWDSLPTVRGYPLLIERLLQNLIENSLKFCGPDPCRIRVRAERSGREWIVSVEDNGVGIDPKDRERAFQIFKRLDPKSEQPGTGVGLAVCKKIVGLHGGKIWIEGEPSSGTTVRFTLPAA